MLYFNIGGLLLASYVIELDRQVSLKVFAATSHRSVCANVIQLFHIWVSLVRNNIKSLIVPPIRRTEETLHMQILNKQSIS